MAGEILNARIKQSGEILDNKILSAKFSEYLDQIPRINKSKIRKLANHSIQILK